MLSLNKFLYGQVKELISLLDSEPPPKWLEYYQTLSTNTMPYEPDITDPMDIVFHTEEVFENAFPTSEEFTHHELTEELVEDVFVEPQVAEKKTTQVYVSRTLLFLVIIIVILLFILVYMQIP